MEIEMGKRFPVEHPWKRICEYETFCFYHGGLGRGEDNCGIPKRAAATMGAWGAHAEREKDLNYDKMKWTLSGFSTKNRNGVKYGNKNGILRNRNKNGNGKVFSGGIATEMDS